MEDDQGPRLRLEVTEATFQLVTVRRSRRFVGDAGGVDLGELDVEAMPPESARLIDAGADEQAVKPGVESVGAAQRWQVSPGSDERLLDGVLGLVWIAQDEPGGGIQSEDRGASQRGEGVMIAFPRSLHEI